MKRICSVLFLLVLLLCSATAYAETWQCEKCDGSATGNFCSNCGNAKPVAAENDNEERWLCSQCETSVIGNFCANCGYAKPAKSTESDAEKQIFSEDTIVLDDETKYAMAVEHQNTECYIEAIELFAEISEYSDADFRLMSCVEHQAAKYYENEEYSAAQALLLQYPFETTAELLAQCNDHCFIIDLQNALSTRWAQIGVDTTLMSEKKVKEYLASLVSDEMKYLGKYNNLLFSDSVLAEYAYGYISALQNQWIGISEYYGVDQDAYAEYWTYQGVYKREQMIYWINRKYGLDLPSEYREQLRSSVVEGQLIDMWYTTEEMLVKQLYALQYSMKTDRLGTPVLLPISIKNRTNYQINYLNIYMNFYNAKGEMIDRSYLFWDSDINSGSNISFSDLYFESSVLDFDSISFSYEFSVANEEIWSGDISGTVVPQVQFSLKNGLLMKNGTLAEGQPVFEITSLSAKWEENQFTSKKLYVPTLKFSVKNTGNASADKVTVRCTFIDQDTHEIWSEETEYVVGSSDSSLMPDYSKKAIVYSSIGYPSRPTSVPNLVAEIYVNGTLVKTVSIKP